jgi:tetratricopeptide (TPR) repeat protein/transcriptional regulator with XRE-family HTH domain
MPKKPNNLLRQARLRAGWSQEELAQRLDTNKFTVNRWERGVTVPHPHYRRRLSLLLNATLAELGLDLIEDLANPSQQSHLLGLLPTPPTHFIGREQLFMMLRQALLQHQKPFKFAMHGLPGVGKTAIARQLANEQEIQRRYADGILWAGLGPTPNVMSLLALWARSLNMPEHSIAQSQGADALGKAIRMSIGTQSLLLIIDDAWSIHDLLAFQVGGAHCSYLVTTRFPEVAARFTPDMILAIPEFDPQTGLALLQKLAPKAVGFAAERAMTLVQLVGGLPLALTLLGHYLYRESLSGQPRRIQAALDTLLDAEKRFTLEADYAPVERPSHIPSGTPLSLKNTITISFDRLPEHMQQTLCRLSFFPPKPNSFSEEAALVLVSEDASKIRKDLDGLVDTGLLETHSAGRFTIHQTIADFVRRQAEKTFHIENLLAYYVRLLQASSDKDQVIDQEMGNICAALDYIQHEPSLPMSYVECSLTIAEHLAQRGSLLQAENYLERALTQARLQQDRPLISRILTSLGWVLEQRGDLDKAAQFAREAYSLGIPEKQGDLFHLLGKIALAKGETKESDHYLSRSFQMMQSADEEQKLKLFTTLIAWKRITNDVESAERYCLEGLTQARKLKKEALVCDFYQSLSALAGNAGKYEAARMYAQEGLVIARRIHYHTQIEKLLSMLALAAKSAGDYQQAEAQLREALAYARQTQQLPIICGLLIYLADVVALQGRSLEAEETIQEALHLGHTQGYHERICQALITLTARILIPQQRFSEGEMALQECQHLAEKAGHSFFLCNTLLAWGDLHLGNANSREAEKVLIEALACAPNLELKGDALFGLAQVAKAQAKPAQAYEFAQQSYQIYVELKHAKADILSKWIAQHWAKSDEG